VSNQEIPRANRINEYKETVELMMEKISKIFYRRRRRRRRRRRTGWI
jgi:membrane glycosyltransferase